MAKKLTRGTQVVYIPSHVVMPSAGVVEVPMLGGYPNGAQPGFITSGPARSVPFGSLDTYYVRYWIVQRGKPIRELRTKANSEATPLECLKVVDSVPEEWVKQALEEFC